MKQGIKNLLEYGLEHHLFTSYDYNYLKNQLISFLDYGEYDLVHEVSESKLINILNNIINYQINNKKLEDDIVLIELYKSKLMNILMPRPSQVFDEFTIRYETSPDKATDYLYELAQSSNYIKVDRLKLDKKWRYISRYGILDLSINLAKPEKDPKTIALELQHKQSNYPLCPLCIENEGYQGSYNQAPRNEHRLIPLNLNNTSYYLQYSPYVYYNEHCIVINKEHRTMKIDKECFKALLDFVDIFPHYFIGSNADLPIVGGSILSHDHFQGGNYQLPITQAKVIDTRYSRKYPNILIEILEWPLSTIRLKTTNKNEILEFASHILTSWQEYSNEKLEILARTNGVNHNTITPIVRKNNEYYEFDLVLRNNRTNEQYPDGIFHAHPQWHAIKKENIGLIEVMGLAILPARLDRDLNNIQKSLKEDIKLLSGELKTYQNWYDSIKMEATHTTNLAKFIEDQVAKVFVHVLEDCGVFKLNRTGIKAFKEFISDLEK